MNDRATRGACLTSEERLQLDEWYREQDLAEEHNPHGTAVETTVAALRSQVTEALNQLQALTGEIHNLAADNEILRREVTAFRERLAQRPISQSA